MNKKSIIATLAIGLAFGAVAGVPYEPLNLPEGSHHPVISPDGKTILFSSDVHTGLKTVDLASGEISVIDEGAAAGFEPVFSTDGNSVYYRTAEMQDGLLYRDVRTYNFKEGSVRRLAKPSRDNVDLLSLSKSDYAVADFDVVRLHRQGKELTIRPVADSHSYLWASLSSDGKKLLVTEPFQGVFVADADGNDARKVLDKGDFASWVGKDKIIAVVTKDDGYVVLSSQLVLVDINSGKVEALTDESIKVGEATASEAGNVVFTDISGNMFIIKLNDR